MIKNCFKKLKNIQTETFYSLKENINLLKISSKARHRCPNI